MKIKKLPAKLIPAALVFVEVLTLCMQLPASAALKHKPSNSNTAELASNKTQVEGNQKPMKKDVKKTRVKKNKTKKVKVKPVVKEHKTTKPHMKKHPQKVELQ